VKLQEVEGRDILTIALIITTVVSAGVAIPYTYDYYQFYPAVKQLGLTISSFDFNPTNTSLNAIVVFNITSPSSYSGLAVTYLTATDDIRAPGNVTIPQGLIPYSPPRRDLTPGTHVIFAIPFIGEGYGPYRVTQFLKTNSTKPQFIFEYAVSLFLSSFLDTYAEVILAYSCSATVNSGSCTSAGIFLNLKGPSSSGGGL